LGLDNVTPTCYDVVNNHMNEGVLMSLHVVYIINCVGLRIAQMDFFGYQAEAVEAGFNWIHSGDFDPAVADSLGVEVYAAA
jgi:hypothetical protein